ncbi:MAG: outer membrane protein assembly factor BamE [Acidobacteriia bacterium]|nr:outer membrane protein assembly factor BamE [Terriglobia bacterium]
MSPFETRGFYPTDGDFHVHYDHFYPGLEIPARWEKRNNLDDHTTEGVTGAQGVDEMESGEMLEVLRTAILKRPGNFYAVDLMMKALSGKRLPAAGTYSPQSYGVHFRFAFPVNVIEGGNYDAVVSEINKYFLPMDEYQQAAESAKNIEIQPGMSKEEVVKALGEPIKTITFGKKTILKYQDMAVELEENKVVEVKAN